MMDCLELNECVIKIFLPKVDQLNDSYKIMKFQNFNNQEPVASVIVSM